MTGDEVVSCTFVLSTGPLGPDGAPLNPMALLDQFPEHGVLRVREDGSDFTQDMREDIRIAVTVEARDAEGVRWFAREALLLTESHLSWGDMERQLASK
ncbi:MAG: hypothetical protein M3256_00690 [Actinomycetota bacterium]|nr:hypothetical protein [Actinomycetota bacterium]